MSKAASSGAPDPHGPQPAFAQGGFSGRVVVVAAVSVDRGGPGTHAHAAYGVHLGAVCALEFARRGATVVAIDTSAAALQALVAQAMGAAGTVETVVADPSVPGDLAHAAREVQARHGVAHVLVNAHHDSELASVMDTSDEAWARVLAFDVLGPVYATRAFVPLLARAEGAAVVHLGSIDGLQGNPQIPAYSAAKGALVPLTHVMAEEFAPLGIRVNCVARAMVSPRDAPRLNPMFAPLIPHTPLARPAWPEEVAAAVRFLASEEASYITGVVLPVDGGRTGVTPGTRPSMRTPRSPA